MFNLYTITSKGKEIFIDGFISRTEARRVADYIKAIEDIEDYEIKECNYAVA